MLAAPRPPAQVAGAVKATEISRSLRKLADSTHPAAVPACHAANGTWSARGVEGSLDARQLPQMHRVSSVPFSWLFPPRYSRSPAIRKRRRSVRTLLKEAPCVGKGVPRNPRPAATSTSLGDTSPSPFASAYPEDGIPRVAAEWETRFRDLQQAAATGEDNGRHQPRHRYPVPIPPRPQPHSPGEVRPLDQARRQRQLDSLIGDGGRVEDVEASAGRSREHEHRRNHVRCALPVDRTAERDPAFEQLCIRA